MHGESSTVAQLLAAHMERMKLSAYRLAKEGDIPKQTIEGWLRGKRPRDWRMLCKVGERLGLSLSEINQLLRAAGYPTIESMTNCALSAEDTALLARWASLAKQHSAIRTQPVRPAAIQELAPRQNRRPILITCGVVMLAAVFILMLSWPFDLLEVPTSLSAEQDPKPPTLTAPPIATGLSVPASAQQAPKPPTLTAPPIATETSVPAVLRGRNLALEAALVRTDSNFNDQFTGAQANDGVVTVTSKWTSARAEGPHWLSYDLGGLKTITGFIVRHAGATGEGDHFNTLEFYVESAVSLDGPWVQELHVDNSVQKADVTTHPLAALKQLRYVRLRIAVPGQDSMARIAEFEVWGADDLFGLSAAPAMETQGSVPQPTRPSTPSPSPALAGRNLALEAALVRTDSDYNAEYTGSQANDGRLEVTSKWASGQGAGPHWLSYDLGGLRKVIGFIVRHAGATGEGDHFNTLEFSIESAESMDGPWTQELHVDNSGQKLDVTTHPLAAPKQLRYVRLRIAIPGQDSMARIAEFEVWGE